MSNIGDIVEQDGQKYKVVDVREQTYDDGAQVTIIVTEPVG